MDHGLCYDTLICEHMYCSRYISDMCDRIEFMKWNFNFFLNKYFTTFQVTNYMYIWIKQGIKLLQLNLLILSWNLHYNETDKIFKLNNLSILAFKVCVFFFVCTEEKTADLSFYFSCSDEIKTSKLRNFSFRFFEEINFVGRSYVTFNLPF